MDHFLRDAPSLMHLVSGELLLPVLLPGCFHLGQGHLGGSQLIETNLFFFPESLYELRSKTGSEAPHGRKKTQEIEATMIRGKTTIRKGKIKRPPHSTLSRDNTSECLEQCLAHNQHSKDVRYYDYYYHHCHLSFSWKFIPFHFVRVTSEI